jgi:DNA-binding NtrC family response regulator
MYDAPAVVPGLQDRSTAFVDDLQLCLAVRSTSIDAGSSQRDLNSLEFRAHSLIARERAGTNGDPLRMRIETVRVLARIHADREGELCAIVALGLLGMECGEWRHAAACLAQGARIARGVRDRAYCLYAAAIALSDGGLDPGVLSNCARAARLLRGRDPVLRASLLRIAANQYILHSDHMRARKALDRIRDIPGIDQFPMQLSLLRLTEGGLLHREGRLEASLLAHAEAQELMIRTQPSGHRTDRLYADSTERQRPLPSVLDPTPASVLNGWGETLLSLSRVEEARAKGLEALGVRCARGWEHGRTLFLLGRVDFELGMEAEGIRRLEAAEEKFRTSRWYCDLAQLLLTRAEMVSVRETDLGTRESVREGLFEARLYFKRLGLAELMARCDLALETLRARPVSEAGTRGLSVPRLPRVPRMRRLSQLGFLTSDPTILASLEPLESLARTAIPIMILGESGTGKEVLARALHCACGRRGPFVAVNCGALPSDLQESELFGHVRGAFTGAVADKVGLFEAADCGVLLLDEVGEMTPRAQVKLLRILELGEVRRVGETRTRRVDVRVIAATNADLLTCLREGVFRLDLYYRLCGLKITLPPLRDRLGDVPLLAGHFAKMFTPHGQQTPVLSPEALDRLMRHTWPGNVRELRFAIERALALSVALGRPRIEADCIGLEPVPQEVPSIPGAATCEDVSSAGGLEAFIENMERRLILRALEESGWNRTRAARSLGGMSRTTLIGKMKRLGLFPAQGDVVHDPNVSRNDAGLLL